MNVRKKKCSDPRLMGEALFVPGVVPVDSNCTDTQSELACTFTDCAPETQGPQISVSSDVSDWSDKSDTVAGYTIVQQVARTFQGWITVAAETVIRNVVQAFRRIICEAKAVFNRNVLIREGGLRL